MQVLERNRFGFGIAIQQHDHPPDCSVPLHHRPEFAVKVGSLEAHQLDGSAGREEAVQCEWEELDGFRLLLVGSQLPPLGSRSEINRCSLTNAMHRPKGALRAFMPLFGSSLIPSHRLYACVEPIPTPPRTRSISSPVLPWGVVW